jgi:hypothetical protein
VEKWQRREHKLKKRREAMRVHGQGLKKVLLPLIARKAEEAKRAAQKEDRPLPDSGARE